jgi:hypothetical protein
MIDECRLNAAPNVSSIVVATDRAEIRRRLIVSAA